MKHQKVLLTFLFISSAMILPAQKTTVGFSAAANLTFWTWKTTVFGSIPFDPGINYRLAVPVRYQFLPKVALQGELAVNRRSSRSTLTLTDGNGNDIGETIGTQTYRNFEGSLLALFQPLNKWKNLYFLGGTSVGYVDKGWLLATKKQQEVLGLDRRVDLSEILNPPFQRVQWTLDTGVGYSQTLKNSNRLFVEIRNQWNINDYIENGLVKARFSTLMLNMGYLVGL